MKYHYLLFLLLFILTNCDRVKDTCGHDDFCCEINGKKWWPSTGGGFKAKSSLQSAMDSDGKFLTIEAHNGTSALLIGIPDSSLVKVGMYTLTGKLPGGKASYSSGAGPSKSYETDSLHTGIVTITQLDRNKRINVVAGTFSFKAQNPLSGEVVDVAKGTFRTEYIRY